MSETFFNRYSRYVKYFAQWLFCEKIRGLDFSMRDTSLLELTKGELHGYSKTDESHAREIFKRINVNKEKRLLDVGCGKGAFLREACREPFGKIAGLEYVTSLAETARKNFRKLGLMDRVQIFQGDAASFDHYLDYNVFYFFNPFGEGIMSEVLARITDNRKECAWIILHNPVFSNVVENYGCKEIGRLYDKVKSYETRIYLWNNHSDKSL